MDDVSPCTRPFEAGPLLIYYRSGFDSKVIKHLPIRVLLPLLWARQLATNLSPSSARQFQVLLQPLLFEIFLKL